MSLGHLAHVVVLRETGVVVAAVIGTRLMGEAQGLPRMIAATLVATGAVTMNAAG